MPGRFVSVPTGPVYVHDYGGTGEPIIALHGLGGAHLNWMPVSGLAHHGHLYAPDLPGFGYTPPHGSFTVASHARVMSELIEALGAPAVLFGNSLGALVAMLIAADQPHLVERLVLLGPASPPRIDDPRIDRMTARRLMIQGLPVLGPAFVRKYWRSTTPQRQLLDTLAVVCHRPDRVPREVFGPSLDLTTTRRHQPWAIDAMVKSGRSSGSWLVHRSRYEAMVGKIKAPTLIIQGSEDRVIAGSGVEWLSSLRPDWELVIMPGVGHCPQLEAPADVEAAYSRWLSAPPTGSAAV
ncbi:MAG: alpha/beta fold hydrolase [Actinomycetota bacterium]